MVGQLKLFKQHSLCNMNNNIQSYIILYNKNKDKLCTENEVRWVDLKKKKKKKYLPLYTEPFSIHYSFSKFTFLRIFIQKKRTKIFLFRLIELSDKFYFFAFKLYNLFMIKYVRFLFCENEDAIVSYSSKIYLKQLNKVTINTYFQNKICSVLRRDRQVKIPCFPSEINLEIFAYYCALTCRLSYQNKIKSKLTPLDVFKDVFRRARLSFTSNNFPSRRALMLFFAVSCW